jgi:alpha-tubulin suppressor-like RCC1 family protein
MRRPLFAFSTSVLPVLLAGCAHDVTPPSPVTSVEVRISSADLVPGETALATATARLQDGSVATGRAVTWSISPADRAEVNTSGNIRALAPGTVAVRASVGSTTGEATLSIAPGGVLGAAGGVLRTPDQRASLAVPSGALSGQVGVRFELEPAPAADSRLVANSAYRVSASASFAVPAVLTITWDVGDIPGGVAEALHIREQRVNGWTRLPSTLNAAARTVTASVGGPGTFAAFGQGPLARMLDASSDSLGGRVGGAVAGRPAVRLLNVQGEPLRRLPVTFQVRNGSGTLGASSDTTLIVMSDTAGLATVSWTLGRRPGAHTLTAAAGGQQVTISARAIGFLQIVAGEGHSCALSFGGEPWCWGRNHLGQTGVGQISPATGMSPVSASPSLTTITSVSANHTCGLRRDGTALCWGDGRWGQTGQGALKVDSVPRPLGTLHTWRAISASGLHTCAVTPAGNAWCWGFNNYGQLGNGAQEDAGAPQPVSGGLRFSAIATGLIHTCALDLAGAAWCWGDWTSQGSPLPNARLTPAAIGGPAFASITAGRNHACALTSAGTAYCWGANFGGQLGDGTEVGRSVPTPVAGGLSFVQIVAGTNYTCGRTAAGAAWCWGLDVAPFATRSVPNPVPGTLRFVHLAAGGHTCGIADDTTAWCWGSNDFTQLGNNSFVASATPVQVVFPWP